mgnify:CR=1 FL=1
MISHWDAYEFSIHNNYRVYHDPSTDTWSMIPTGIDQTFGGDQDPWPQPRPAGGQGPFASWIVFPPSTTIAWPVT